MYVRGISSSAFKVGIRTKWNGHAKLVFEELGDLVTVKVDHLVCTSFNKSSITSNTKFAWPFHFASTVGCRRCSRDTKMARQGEGS